MKRLALAALAVSLVSCTKTGFLKAPEADDSVTEKVGSFSTDTHFLLEPSADAEDLLGRAVHLTSKGGWTIADERAPGCNVRVKRSSAEYEKSYRIGLGDMTAMSGGYGDLLKLEARYGRSVEAAMKIQNMETLTADTEGPCGEVIVKSVRVGTGERRLVRKAEGSAKAKAGKGPIGAEAGREGLTDVADEMKWSSPQAYAFTYEQSAQRKFESSSDAYLVVFFLEESGAGTVLYPNEQIPVPTVKGGKPLTLPTPDLRPLQAQLRDPMVPARETLVIYAFAARADFDQFKPAAFGDGENAVSYAANLTKALASVPISRWARVTATYEIQPSE